MATPPDHYHISEHSTGHYPAIEALARDVDRLRQLTRPYVADGDADLGHAVARIPGEDARREARGTPHPDQEPQPIKPGRNQLSRAVNRLVTAALATCR